MFWRSAMLEFEGFMLNDVFRRFATKYYLIISTKQKP